MINYDKIHEENFNLIASALRKDKEEKAEMLKKLKLKKWVCPYDCDKVYNWYDDKRIKKHIQEHLDKKREELLK